MGYSPSRLSDLARRRKRGFIYYAENAYGWSPTSVWTGRAGFQQTVDALTGSSWDFARDWNLDKPVLPPFANADIM